VPYFLCMLSIIGTPIGNLEDITVRAQRILREADFLIVESIPDTRRLLAALKIEAPELIKFNERNNRALPNLIERLTQEHGAFVTSAGMPSVSDPGAELLAACYEHDIEVEPIPGVSAVPTAVAMAGFDAKRFIFLGFVPRKKSRITNLIERYAEPDSLVIFFDSPFRVLKNLQTMAEFAADLDVFVGREMTKKFQQYQRGSIQEIIAAFEAGDIPAKGEFTIIVRKQVQ